MVTKLSKATLGDRVNRKCKVCGDYLKLHSLDKEEDVAWLSCPYFLNGTDEDADEHTSYSIPLSLTGVKSKKSTRIQLPRFM